MEQPQKPRDSFEELLLAGEGPEALPLPEETIKTFPQLKQAHDCYETARQNKAITWRYDGLWVGVGRSAENDDAPVTFVAVYSPAALHNPQPGVVIFTPKEWQAFILGVKDNEFDFHDRDSVMSEITKRGSLLPIKDTSEVSD